MASFQKEFPLKPTIDPAQEPLVWKNWKHEHPEFQRSYDTKINYTGDKILVIGGYLPNINQKTLNLILMDPENQTFKVIPSTGDAEACCWGDMSACYWKDSTIIVSGGYDYYGDGDKSIVAIVTLKDLDSENPSAHWQKMETPIEMSHSSAYIYHDRMYIFGGYNGKGTIHDVWCLDLVESTWSKCDFKEYFPRNEKGHKKFIFHENKVYAIPKKNPLAEINIIKEFDLETMCYKPHNIQKIMIEPKLLFEPLPYLIDKKIYFLENENLRAKDSPPMRQVLTFDLVSQTWTEIKTESFPSPNKIGRALYCNNHLIFSPFLEGDVPLFGEFWSLSLNPQKSSTYSATSATVNKVQQALKEFLSEAPYSDVSFEVRSQTIPAHKYLLIQKSKFFANLFSTEQGSKIVIKDIKAPTFRALLEYLYSDHVEIDDTIALELLEKADKYFVTGELKVACEKHILKNIEPENYVAFGKLAESIGATSLREAVVLFIARNMKKIKARKDFDDISDALLRDSIVKFIVK